MIKIVNRDGFDRYEDDDLPEALGTGLLPPRPGDKKGPLLSSVMPVLTPEQAIERSELIDHKAVWESLVGLPDYQNGVGSCASWGLAIAARAVRRDHDHEDVRLSGASVYPHVNGGRDSGSHLHENMAFGRDRGIAPHALMPNLRALRKSQIPDAAEKARGRFRLVEPLRLTTEMEIVTAVLAGYAPVIAIQVTGQWRKFDESDNWLLAPSGRGRGNHCEALAPGYVRYDAKTGLFRLVKMTSHHLLAADPNYGGDGHDEFGRRSRGYGDRGLCEITFKDHLRYTMDVHRPYAVTGTVDDPEAANPMPGVAA
ncbi:MAG: hypothetical protein AAF532_14000 [Planctomycetota bacterium]